MLLISSSLGLCLCLLVLLRSIDDAAGSFAAANGFARRRSIHSTLALKNPKAEDAIVMAGDAASLCFFSVVQNVVDPYEPSVSSLLGSDAVADYRLDVLANPLVASAVVVPCWLAAGAFSGAYTAGSSLRTAEESLKNVLGTFVLYIPCVTVALALLGGRGDGAAVIAAPDFTFCAGAISVVGSWRFTLATTIGK